MSIKQQMKPISVKELDKHKVRYLEAKRLKELQLYKDRQRIQEQVEDKVREDETRLDKYKMNGMKTPKVMIQYEKEIQEKLEKERLKEEKRRKIQERVQNYSHYVREMYYP